VTVHLPGAPTKGGAGDSVRHSPAQLYVLSSGMADRLLPFSHLRLPPGSGAPVDGYCPNPLRSPASDSHPCPPSSPRSPVPNNRSPSQTELFAENRGLISRRAVAGALQKDHLPAPRDRGLLRLHRWQTRLGDPVERASISEASDKPDFIRDLFEDLLGYRTQGASDQYDIRSEISGSQTARSADQVLGFFGGGKEPLIRAVVEVKGPSVDLDQRSYRTDRLSAVDQAFHYAKDHDGCEWVIVTNFLEIRLYSHLRGSTVFERFLLPELHGAALERFVFMLRRENLLGDGVVPPKTLLLAHDTWREQESITQRFYGEYQQARAALYEELRRQNQEQDPIEVLSATQLLLDRLLFIMFCVDRGLLPQDVLDRVRGQGDPRNFAGPDALWDATRRLFRAVDKGDEFAGVPPYNGGLFAEGLLDRLNLKNDSRTSEFILSQVLAWDEFDFDSQIDVDILGHVFENSISDIEKLRREIDQDPAETRLSWRNREGIFYTPPWVTKYVVDHTVARLLEEHPEVGPGLKVLDMACGSGAFLIQLIPVLRDNLRIVAPDESKALDEAAARRGDALDLFHDPTRLGPGALYAALRRVVHGIDRSHESVEITRLSFWLKTVVQGRPLPPLDTNIVHGNALCDDPELDAAALDWHHAFPFFPDRGFDVVVGNPPWVTTPPDYAACLTEFELSASQSDLAFLFVERALSVLREGGYLGLILPDSLLFNEETEAVRRLLVERNQVVQVIKLGEGVFPGVFRSAVLIVVRRLRPSGDYTFKALIVTKEDRSRITDVANDVNLNVLMRERGSTIAAARILQNPRCELQLFVGDEDAPILAKIESAPLAWAEHMEWGRGVELNSSGDVVRCPYCFKWDAPPRKRKGVEVPKNCAHCGETYQPEDALERTSIIASGEGPDLVPFLDGTDVARYRLRGRRFLRVGLDGVNYKEAQLYKSPKIVFRQAGIGITATADLSGNSYVPQSVYVLRVRAGSPYRLEYVLGVLNSRVMLYHYFKSTGQIEWQSFPRWTIARVTTLPVPAIDWGNPAQVRLHERIADEVASLLRTGHDGSPTADLRIERLVMELYGLDPEEITRIWATLRTVQELQALREVLPPRQPDLDKLGN